MSFQRLRNISKRYTNAPPHADTDDFDDDPLNSKTTLRLPSDETDNESVATDDSEDTVITDNGVEHIMDYRARVLQRRAAKARLDNTLQYAHDIAGTVCEEVALHLQVAGVLSVRLVKYLFRYATHLFWYATHLFWYATHLFWYATHLLSRILWSIPDTLRLSWRYLAWPATLFSIAILVAVSLLSGYKGMSTYICKDQELLKTWTALPDVCRHASLQRNLQAAHSELARLANTSNHIMTGTHELTFPGFFSEVWHSNLGRESEGLVSFVKAHEDNSMIKRTRLSEVAKDLWTNAFNMTTTAKNFKSDYTIRHEVLIHKLNDLLESAKKVKPHSPAERFFSEAIYYYLPSAFSHSNTHRLIVEYDRIARHFLRDPLTLSLTKHHRDLSQKNRAIQSQLQIVRTTLTAYQHPWVVGCQDWKRAHKPDVDRCALDPQDVLSRLERAAAEADAATQAFTQVHAQHKHIMQAFGALHKNFADLLDNARGLQGASKTTRVLSALHDPQGQAHLDWVDVDAMPARAALHDFVTWVGDRWRGVRVGERPVDGIAGQMPPSGVRQFVGKDGTVGRHAVGWEFWNENDNWENAAPDSISHL